MALRAVLKLALLGLIAWLSLKAALPRFNRISALSSAGVAHELIEDLASLGLKLSAALALLAALDFVRSRREFAKKMRMSKRELKDEVKQRDGDPRVRARMRELRREALKRSMSLRHTKNADVVVVNPTHIAVALRYVHGEMVSPQVVAKGRGVMALAIRQLATRHRIPVVHSPSLARQLFADLDLGHHVTPQLYQQVARIIVWVLARRDARRARVEGGQAWAS